METFIAVLLKFKSHPVTVFFEAFHWFEVRASEEDMNNIFRLCCREVPEGLRVTRVPESVELYCKARLAGQAVPLERPPPPKLLGEGDKPKTPRLPGDEWKDA